MSSESILTIIDQNFARDVNGRTLAKAKCECGEIVIRRRTYITSGKVKSCGCLKNKSKHGRHGTPEYNAWRALKRRASSEKVELCTTWTDFANFRKDMGRRPGPNYVLERLDKNGNFSPTNCHWLPKQEWANSRKPCVNISYQGSTKTLKQWSKHLGVKYQTLQYRYRQGWTTSQILDSNVKGAR